MLIQTASKIFFDKNQHNMLKLIFESVSYIQDSGMKWVKTTGDIKAIRE